MSGNTYQIGAVAKKSGLSVQTLRYYEREGLIEPQTRSAGGYRLYDEGVFDAISRVRHLKSLGFSLRDINEIASLTREEAAVTRTMRDRASGKVKELDEKILALTDARDRLARLVSSCPGDETSINACPILKERNFPD